MGSKGTLGILNPGEGFKHFSLEREAPSDELAAFVEGFWSVHWDLDAGASFEQEILPYPCVNLSTAAGGFEVHGPGTQRFAAQLSGRGYVSGTKFTPSGFFAFAHVPMRDLVDKVTSVEAVTGRNLRVPRDVDARTVRTEVETFLRSFAPVRTEDMALADRLVRLAQEDRSIARAEHLARAAGASVRSLHRLFERHVGVGPKWVVRRSRVQEAAERMARGEQIDLAATAQELGYHDQAHFTHDFRAQVGFTPAAYARRCAASQRRRVRDHAGITAPSRRSRT
jgi:AraC-like DNA-binding protein